MRPRVQKVEEKVLKIDRPLAGGFSGLTAALPLRVVVAAPPQFLASFPRKEVAPKGETTHYDLRVAIAPSNHVRCARR